MKRRLNLSIILFFLAFTQAFTMEEGNSQIGDLEWMVGLHGEKGASPRDWFPARVPGAVQLDYARAKGWGDHNFAENWKEYRWMEDIYWTYKTSFTSPGLESNQRLFFISKGIDYEFEILLNGQQVFAQEGRFSAVSLDITEHLEAQNLLEIRILPVPKLPGEQDDRNQAAQCVKPAVSDGWDWHPRLIPSGIWDETYLEIRNVSHFQDVFVDYNLSDDFQEVAIGLQVEGINLVGKNFEWTLTDPDGIPVLEEMGKVLDLEQVSFLLNKPQLWWTHDHGQPSLYSVITNNLIQ